MDGSVNKASQSARAAKARLPGQIGIVISVSGFKLTCLLFGESAHGANDAAYASAQIGTLVKVPTPRSVAYGFLASLEFEQAAGDQPMAMAVVDLLGEATSNREGKTSFARGISLYPVL